MKTNLGIETTDEERLKIGLVLYGKEKMVTRADLKEAINEYVRSLIAGKEARPAASPSAEAPACEEAEAIRNRSICGFVPSRGDESYLYKPKDSELAAVCSSVLDGLQYIEEYTWDALEKNRSTS